MPTPTDRPKAMPTSTSTATETTTYFQFDKFLPLYIFPRLAFMIIIFFSFSYFLLHMVFANYSSKWNYSYATFSILIKTAKQFCSSSSNSSFDIFVCLRKCWRENLSWLLCKEIKCILSKINFIAALSERENKEGRKGGKGKNRRRRQG